MTFSSFPIDMSKKGSFEAQMLCRSDGQKLANDRAAKNVKNPVLMHGLQLFCYWHSA